MIKINIEALLSWIRHCVPLLVLLSAGICYVATKLY